MHTCMMSPRSAPDKLLFWYKGAINKSYPVFGETMEDISHTGWNVTGTQLGGGIRGNCPPPSALFLSHLPPAQIFGKPIFCYYKGIIPYTLINN